MRWSAISCVAALFIIYSCKPETPVPVTPTPAQVPTIVGNWQAKVPSVWEGKPVTVIQEYTLSTDGKFTTISKYPEVGWASASGTYTLEGSDLSFSIAEVDTSGMVGPKAKILKEQGKDQVGKVQTGKLTWHNDDEFLFETPGRKGTVFDRKK